ncbi:hypothetical protein [Entomospira culicis]|uniref:Uncharacterized protein n=1 Tax=Entomospira culicis TaxID=2719989 RepID=A0A968GGT0_9SPIO|nr:hypothetical protein [Entomospira culicis]NIZ19833.1 hypothetical protein [Entomospira culicis]NIZ70047.1 hypothetical protein [Entomospira culicis]WDI37153.1 hypothetical protein PVA46_07480 [Entomospira culicis]WDI38782.1 hypothetical protein PVA47_07490 [Entomospira culicis]
MLKFEGNFIAFLQRQRVAMTARWVSLVGMLAVVLFVLLPKGSQLVMWLSMRYSVYVARRGGLDLDTNMVSNAMKYMGIDEGALQRHLWLLGALFFVLFLAYSVAWAWQMITQARYFAKESTFKGERFTLGGSWRYLAIHYVALQVVVGLVMGFMFYDIQGWVLDTITSGNFEDVNAQGIFSALHFRMMPFLFLLAIVYAVVMHRVVGYYGSKTSHGGGVQLLAYRGKWFSFVPMMTLYYVGAIVISWLWSVWAYQSFESDKIDLSPLAENSSATLLGLAWPLYLALTVLMAGVVTWSFSTLAKQVSLPERAFRFRGKFWQMWYIWLGLFALMMVSLMVSNAISESFSKKILESFSGMLGASSASDESAPSWNVGVIFVVGAGILQAFLSLEMLVYYLLGRWFIRNTEEIEA